MAQRLALQDGEEEIKEAYHVFDTQNKGYISANELRFVMTSIENGLSPQEVEELILEADEDGDGKINYEGET